MFHQTIINLYRPRGMKPRGRPKEESCASPPFGNPNCFVPQQAAGNKFKLFKFKKYQHLLFSLIRLLLLICLSLFPLSTNASFIESTMGAAVVNDATATYYNPAALTLLNNPQIITLGSIAGFRSQFSGQVLQTTDGLSQSGATTQQTHYFLPALYFGMPATDKIAVGLAVISNFFNRDMEENSILRYIEANNRIENIDLVPAIGVKFNDYLAVGAGVNISHANFTMKPISGLQSLTSPDSQSLNEGSGNSWGGAVGILLKISQGTVMGFNYRSAVSYHLSGKSEFRGEPYLLSNHYHFNYWTPARSVFSINHFITPKWGLIGTVHYIQWNIFKDVHLKNIATQIGSQSIILPDAIVHYHLHNSWLITLGSHYRPTTTWIIRVAGSFNQSPASGNYQISNGDSVILGASMGYKFNKNIVLDGGYAHAFIKDQAIDIATARNNIHGMNKGFRDSFSLKLTLNVI